MYIKRAMIPTYLISCGYKHLGIKFKLNKIIMNESQHLKLKVVQFQI